MGQRATVRTLSVSKIAEFSCATVAAVFAALDELAEVGVKIEHLDGDLIRVKTARRPRPGQKGVARCWRV
jgi:hypothetical protein